MALGIIIHVAVGTEKRTEFFGEERIRIGALEDSELQIHTSRMQKDSIWLVLLRDGDVYRIRDYDDSLELKYNGKPIRRYIPIKDGDVISLDSAEISFSFFALTAESSLITTNRDPHIAPFIEEAALGAAATEKRDDAKAFLREFSRELLREISLTSKLIGLVLILGFFSGIFYLGYGIYKEMQAGRELVEKQNQVIKKLEGEIAKTGDQINELDKSNKIVRDIVSLAPNLRVEYGNGVCLIVGVYDLVDRQNGKTLRYPDPESFRPDPYEPQESEEGMYEVPERSGLTTEGNGSPVEYDFIGTGFHVGGGYIVTNRHVLQPWTEDDLVKQLMRQSGGRARIKRLIIYFPNHQTPFALKIRSVSREEDVAVASIDPSIVGDDIPALPLETSSDSVAIGKTVVTMGYPNGPDRLLAMVDDQEAKSINEKYGRSRQILVNYLAQSGKIAPLTTQGAITDLDKHRIVHDAKTAEGGSGAPLFGQTGKVIGVNFGVFTENNAVNMAIPIEYVLELLEKLGWAGSSAVDAGNAQSSQTAAASTPKAPPK
ncbi:MAG: trypsin-like peptidase domain-containing protein [Pyrinomonadaceae bacterium]